MTDRTNPLIDRLATLLGAEVVETHISWVLLTPGEAFKLKKPVRLPFVDYSTLASRKHFCEEELRLNRPLAGDMYLGLSTITGKPDHPAIEGAGPVLDYAVRMRRFAPGSLFSERLGAGTLRDEDVDRFAAVLASFHAKAALAGQPHESGLHGRLMAALSGAAPLLGAAAAQELRDWIAQACREVEPLWLERAQAGRVRECHGDLHLDNVIVSERGVAAVDCIEFDPALRFIDVLEDAAFPLMDFAARGRADLAWRFLDDWLQVGGDYAGLPALPLYVVGRALVRAVVEHLREPGAEMAGRYAQLALAWSRGEFTGKAGLAGLTITHGLPGSGKSFQSQRLAQRGAIRIRSDAERKRLFGLAPRDSSSDKGLDLYTPDVTRRVYARLFELARMLLAAGFAVVLDAAFLREDERGEARSLAAELRVPFAILDCQAPLPVLRERLRARNAQGRDASEADITVLERLCTVQQPLTPQELGLRRAPGD